MDLVAFWVRLGHADFDPQAASPFSGSWSSTLRISTIWKHPGT